MNQEKIDKGYLEFNGRPTVKGKEVFDAYMKNLYFMTSEYEEGDISRDELTVAAYSMTLIMVDLGFLELSDTEKVDEMVQENADRIDARKAKKVVMSTECKANIIKALDNMHYYGKIGDGELRDLVGRLIGGCDDED